MSSNDRTQILEDAYSIMAKLWCSPAEDDIQGTKIKKNTKDLIKRLENVDKQNAMTLSKFLEESTISEEDYIDLFELDPRCPLYVGSHTYEEPKTCATAAVSDRNEYMIELIGIYNHFGQKPNGAELPDYLPLMVDFLALTTKSSDDPVRMKLCNEYLLPFLPPMRSRLGDLETPYLHLLDALERVINVELNAQPSSAQRAQQVESHVG